MFNTSTSIVKKLYILTLGYFIILLVFTNPIHGQNTRQRIGLSTDYPREFKDWSNAYLAGNGKMGIMVFGNPLDETVIFNDRDFNLAKTQDRSFASVNPEDLAKIKELCAAGEFIKANELAVSTAKYQGGGDGNRHPGYAMKIKIPAEGPVQNYKRVCDFRTGQILISWEDNRGKWVRKAFVSRKDNVVVQVLEAPDGNPFSCSLQLEVEPGMHFPDGMHFDYQTSSDYLILRAKYPQGTGDAGYEGVTRVITNGGTRSVSGNTLQIQKTHKIILLSRTQKYFADAGEHWKQQLLQKGLSKLPASYAQLLEGQQETHQEIYDRVNLDFTAKPENRKLTNEALLKLQQESDKPVKALWERLFDAGRYYFLSASSNQMPPDLLGIWTGDCDAGWGGYYHLDANLNLQVSGGNTGNMPEAMEGYFNLNEAWKDDFKTNAQKLLGCRGMVACGNTPGTNGLMANINEYYPYQYATGEEPWLLYPLWEHYLITGDTDFLKDRLYPLLVEMGHFYEDFLKFRDENGNYIFAGSVSPENQPANLKVSLLNNSNFDISGAQFALNALLRASVIIGEKDREAVKNWQEILDHLPPYLINKEGALKEWAWPGLEDHYDHRHSSQLLMVWPYTTITPEKDKRLFDAARETLAKKDAFNYENAGHGILHSTLIAARLKEGNRVKDKLLRLSREGFYFNNLSSSHYVNHGVFCTDVCNAVPAIMMEMLLFSDDGILEFLPALPESLKQGSISGLKTRNGITIRSLSWDMNAKIIRCTLVSDMDQDINLLQREGIQSIEGIPNVQLSPYGKIARVLSLKKEKETRLTINLL